MTFYVFRIQMFLDHPETASGSVRQRYQYGSEDPDPRRAPNQNVTAHESKTLVFIEIVESMVFPELKVWIRMRTSNPPVFLLLKF
jgi:hypothetical protein